MKIFICASKHLYDKVEDIRNVLENNGHLITLPNGYDDSCKEKQDEHNNFKSKMLRMSIQKVFDNDAILVLNFKKNDIENHIGGAVLLEMFKAFELNKKIFLYNPVPNNMLKDEIEGMDPIVINGNLNLIK